MRRSYVGVGGQTVPLHRRIVRFHQLSVESGLLIVSVEPGSPAAQAGLEPGDVLVEFDHQPVSGIDSLHKFLTEGRIGKSCLVTVLRRTEKLVFHLVPAESRRGHPS